jgi:hypothetical protein
MLRTLEFMACYYVTGSYKTQDYGYCMRVKLYRDLFYAVSFLPYYWRAMQVKSCNHFIVIHGGYAIIAVIRDFLKAIVCSFYETWWIIVILSCPL